MSQQFNRIKAGLQQAVEHAQGKEQGVRMHRPRPVDVKALRAKVGMTQEEFARAAGISVDTLQNWEQGRRRPQGAAVALIRIVARDPRVLRRNLAAASA